MFDEPQLDNAFDMGYSTLTRINFWLWKSNDAQFNDDVTAWFKSLKVLFKEVDAFLKPEESKLHKEFLNASENEYKNFLKYTNKYQITIKQFGKNVNYNPPRAIFDILYDWELDLRSLIDKKGLLMKKGEDSGTTITRM